MKTIIAPINFNVNSKNAVRYAAGLAISLNARLEIIHVCPRAPAYHEVKAYDNDSEDLAHEADIKLRTLRDAVMLSVPPTLPVSTRLLRGEIIPELKKYCKKIRPVTLVMGAESKNAVERWLIGATTLAAINEIAYPILVIPAGATFRNYSKIGLACDYKDLAATVPVKEIRILIKKFQSRLHVLHIAPGSWEDFDTHMTEEASWLWRQLDELKPLYEFVRDHNTEEGLCQFAAEKLDLLIIVPKKHGIINRIFQHSHTHRMVLKSPVPLLLMHE